MATFRAQRVTGWMMSLPGLIVNVLFIWFPIFFAFLIALQRYYITKPSVFVGLKNFAAVFRDEMVLTTFMNTFFYAGLALIFVFLLPIFISILLLEMPPRVVRIMMILWFIPIASVGSIVLWKYFYNEQVGLFNAILNNFGLPAVRWLNDERIVIPMLVLPNLIMFGPSLIYIAVLQSIPLELYESAELDGAGFFRKIWHITLPRLRPVMVMMLIFSVIMLLQVFEQPFIMTGGGPGSASTTVGLYIYQNAFEMVNFGKATALAIVLFVLIMVVVVLIRVFFKEDPDV